MTDIVMTKSKLKSMKKEELIATILKLEGKNAELKEQIEKQQHHIEIICNEQKQRMMLLRYIRRSENLEEEKVEIVNTLFVVME